MALNFENIQKILNIVPLFIEMDLLKIQAEYDREADVLYLNFEPDKEATDSEYLEKGIIGRYANDEIIGITILNASNFNITSSTH